VANGFIWYELLAADKASAEAFYRAVVGWSAADAGGPNAGYTLFSAADRPAAGALTLPADACLSGEDPCWIGYVMVDDVDAAAAGVAEAGGSVHKQPADIEGVGRFAVVADPGGAVFGLLAPQPMGSPPPPLPRMTPGHCGWHELYAADGDAAFGFYADRFGWSESATMDMGAMGTYRIWSAEPGGEALGGMMTRPAQMPKPAWLFYFVVDSADAAADRIRAAGGQVTNGPMDVPDGSRIVQGTDSQGAAFALVSARS